MKSGTAKSRFLLLNLVRFGGVLIVVLGALIWRKGIFGFQDQIVGLSIFVVGVLESLFLPQILSKAWRVKDMRDNEK